MAGCSIGEPGSYYGRDGYGLYRGSRSRAVPGLEEFFEDDIFLTDALTLRAEEEMSRAIEEGVPFIVAWAAPEGDRSIRRGRSVRNTSGAQRLLPIPQGEVRTQIGTIMDIYPTIAALVGARCPDVTASMLEHMTAQLEQEGARCPVDSAGRPLSVLLPQRQLP